MFLRRTLIVAIAVAAILQLVIIIDRSWAALWAWYKFVGDGGGGHIVLRGSTQATFFVGSSVLAGVGYQLWRSERRETGTRLWRGLAQFGWSSIVVSLLFWIALVASPLVTFAH